MKRIDRRNVLQAGVAGRAIVATAGLTAPAIAQAAPDVK
jgi:hypothetical protein